MNRHVIALLITLGIYVIPGNIYQPPNSLFWLNSAAWSIAYIMSVNRYGRTRETPILIACECFAILTNLIVIYVWSIKNQETWFYNQYENIMYWCFITEVIVILWGMLRSGLIKRAYSICVTYTDRWKAGDRHILLHRERL